MYARRLDLPALLGRKSCFLLGPRGVGKSTLARESFPEGSVHDLLDGRTFQDLLRRPALLGEGRGGVVVIDEVLRLPDLLHEVHRLIESGGRVFLLMGSSARKFRGKGVNLLGGRASMARLFPLVSAELPDFDLLRYLNRGGLPKIYDSDDPEGELRDYVNLYLREEIQNEAVTRSVQAFAEFLDVMALTNGQEINYEGLASDLQVSAGTVRNYIDILDDTLVGFRLHGYTKTKKRKATSRFKYYLFDLGVTNVLGRRGVVKEKSPMFGWAFEHFILLEVRAFLGYARKEVEMRYWRSTTKFEVDLVIGDEVAVEVKATDLVQDRDLKGMRMFKEEGLVKRYVVVSLDRRDRRTADGVEILPWRRFLEELWKGEVV